MSPADDPWTLRHVTANGARFRVATVGTGPLVLFLHGFPEFWWAWRHQLTPVAAAGFRAVAMDLRGYGGSDKPPRGYDPLTLSADVAGVVGALGSRDAVLVGHGWGGYVAWTAAITQLGCVRALVAVGSPHPAELLRLSDVLRNRAAVSHLGAMQVPWIPERRIMSSDYIGRHLRAWTAPGSAFPTDAEVERYREALAVWPAPHCAVEYHRWLLRSRARPDGRAFAARMRARISVPVLQVRGSHDPVVSLRATHASARRVSAAHRVEEIDGAGHFVHEERPAAFTEVLVRWLSAQSERAVSGGGLAG